MTKKRKIISTSVREEFLEHLKRKAVEMSVSKGRPVNLAEVIRLGLQAAFPTNKQEMLDL